jgi:hypothetical protein
MKADCAFQEIGPDLGIVVHAYNPSTHEAEAEGWKVQGQPG